MSENESPDAEASQHRRPDDWALDRGRDHALTGEEIELPGAEFGDAADIVGLSSVPVVTGEIEAVSIGARRSSNPNVGLLQPKIEDRIATGEIPVAPVPSASAIPVVPAPGARAEAEPDAGPRDSGASGREPSGAPGPEAGAASTTAREQEGAPEPAVEGAGAKGRAGGPSGPSEPAPSPETAKEPGSAHSSEPGAPTAPPDSGDEGPAPAPAPGAPPDSAPAPEAEPVPSPEPEPDAGAPGAADAAFPPPAPADTRSTQDTIISDRPLVPRSSAQPGKERGARKGAGAPCGPRGRERRWRRGTGGRAPRARFLRGRGALPAAPDCDRTPRSPSGTRFHRARDRAPFGPRGGRRCALPARARPARHPVARGARRGRAPQAALLAVLLPRSPEAPRLAGTGTRGRTRPGTPGPAPAGAAGSPGTARRRGTGGAPPGGWRRGARLPGTGTRGRTRPGAPGPAPARGAGARGRTRGGAQGGTAVRCGGAPLGHPLPVVGPPAWRALAVPSARGRRGPRQAR